MLLDNAQIITNKIIPTVNMLSIKDKSIHVTKDLERKAEILRIMQASNANKCKKWINTISYLTLFFSMLISFLAIADPTILSLDEANSIISKRIIAVSGFMILFLSYSDRIFGLHENYARYDQSVKLLTDFIRKCHQFRHVEVDNEEEASLKLTALQDYYSQINHILPLLNPKPNQFLRAKQEYLIKKISAKNWTRIIILISMKA